MTTFRIVRRAWGVYNVVETFEGSFVDASERADALQRERRDGEYFPRFPGASIKGSGESNSCPVQAAWAYL